MQSAEDKFRRPIREAIVDGLNFSPRNMQQLLNNVLKDAAGAVTLTTIAGDQLAVHAPVELGTECISFRTTAGGGAAASYIVPYHAIQRILVS